MLIRRSYWPVKVGTISEMLGNAGAAPIDQAVRGIDRSRAVGPHPSRQRGTRKSLLRTHLQHRSVKLFAKQALNVNHMTSGRAWCLSERLPRWCINLFINLDRRDYFFKCTLLQNVLPFSLTRRHANTHSLIIYSIWAFL